MKNRKLSKDTKRQLKKMAIMIIVVILILFLDNAYPYQMWSIVFRFVFGIAGLYLIFSLLINRLPMGENEDVPESGTKDKESDAKANEGRITFW